MQTALICFYTIVITVVTVLSITSYHPKGGPSPLRRLWAWLKSRSAHGDCTQDVYGFPDSMTLFDRYKALVEQREAARKASQELQNARHIVVTAHLKEILAIVKSETGVELDVTTDFRDPYGFRCDFAVGNTAVNHIWMSFDGTSTTLGPKTERALPAMVDELVAKTKIACPFTTAK